MDFGGVQCFVNECSRTNALLLEVAEGSWLTRRRGEAWLYKGGVCRSMVMMMDGDGWSGNECLPVQ